MDPKLSNFSSGQASALQKTAQHSPRLPELHLPLDKLNWTDQKGQNEAKYLKTTEKKWLKALIWLLFSFIPGKRMAGSQIHVIIPIKLGGFW